MSYTVSTLSFEDMVAEFGVRKDTVGGRVHYITKDEKERAVVGPIHHRRTRATIKALEQVQTPDDLLKLIDKETAAIADAPTITLPTRKVSRMKRLMNWTTEHFWDSEYHKRVRQVIINSLLAGATVGTLALMAELIVMAWPK